MASLTPAQRVVRARAAAFAQHAQGRTNTGPATVAQIVRFERQVDPDGTLAPDERARRARLAQRAHMTLLALRSSRARLARRVREEEASFVTETTEARQEARRDSVDPQRSR